jgi:hypothetical protein
LARVAASLACLVFEGWWSAMSIRVEDDEPTGASTTAADRRHALALSEGP